MASVHRVRSKEGFRYRTRWRDPDGTLRSRSFAHKADANRFAVKVEHEMNVGDYIDPHAGRVTVREYGEKWRKAQLQHATSLLRETIASENQKPNPTDLSGVLTAGVFEQAGRRVVGRWPLPPRTLPLLPQARP